MKNQEIKDERVISHKIKIKSNAYSILIYLLLISILFQQYILHAPVSQFAGEFFCLIAVGIYVALKNISLGFDISNPRSGNLKKLLLNSVFLSAVTAVVLRFISGENDIKNRIVFFISMTIVYFIINFLSYYFVKRKQNHINKELDQEE